MLFRSPTRALDLYAQRRIRFEDFATLNAFHTAHFKETRAAEEALSRRGGMHEILHTGSNKPVEVGVDSPAKFLDLNNFRESFVDPLGLNARQRLLLLALLSHGKRRDHIALFEHGTALHHILEHHKFKLETSLYTDNRSDPKFQDIQALSYPDAHFDLVVHCDVLEHVPDTCSALAETLRVLKPGGAMIFTTPLFPLRRSILRAVISRDGSLVKLLPDEIHGDYLTGGVLTFHNFGWDLIELMRDIGMDQAYAEMCYAPELGLFSNNCPLWTTRQPPQPGNMLPLVLIGQKPG